MVGTTVGTTRSQSLGCILNTLRVQPVVSQVGLFLAGMSYRGLDQLPSYDGWQSTQHSVQAEAQTDHHRTVLKQYLKAQAFIIDTSLEHAAGVLNLLLIDLLPLSTFQGVSPLVNDVLGDNQVLVLVTSNE